MTINYAEVKRCWTKNKSALTRAQNRTDFYKILDVCEQAFRDFDAHGYPDDWMLFKRAAEDATWTLARFSSDEQIQVNQQRIAALR